MSLPADISDLPTALLRIAELLDVIDKLTKIIAEQARTIEAQALRLAQQDVIIAEQAARIASLEEKLRKNSGNSSKPPSSDPLHKPKKPARPRKKSGRKPGGQPGHKKHQRSLLPVEQARSFSEAIPDACEDCGSHSLAEDPEPHRHQVFDSPPIAPLFDECSQHARPCLDCGHVTVGPLPEGMSSLGYTAGVDAMVGLLAGELRLSKSVTAETMTQVFRVPMSTGAVIDAQNRVSAALAEPVAEATEYVQQQPVKNADETPWFQGLQKAYLWACVTSLVTVFQVHLTRKATAAKALLGVVLGILGTDRYSGYSWWPAALRQVCWAHLIRDFVAIVERGGASKTLGEALLSQADRMFAWWVRVKEGTLSRATFQVYMRSVRREVEKLLREGQCNEHRLTAGTCKKIWETREALWTFVRLEGVEPTNNAGERALRFGVLWRKMSRGAKSAKGNAFVARILTVHATLRQQGRGVHAYLREACEAHRSGKAGPSLVPKAAT